ncbi:MULTISPECIES: serine hydrolase domain-containing protein [Actinoplanes]|uniref:serine hydrolase domain-containing protein n=1 Tax=Actinoplanes TaxID=1865 RepID=UPI0005F27967|nr:MULTISPECIES: serine hydrolase domain-containing protein [Actinoplanes]GLY06871.1 hydrolase [Actinoplanes sp. NBRC 101535]
MFLKAEFQAHLDDIHRAGVPGVIAEIRDGDRTWRGAAGVADLATRRPITPDMRIRVGSLTKTFIAVAVLRAGIDLDRTIGDLVPGGRGERITVRMLLNHTSGIPDYLPVAFPSLGGGTPESIDDNRFRHFSPDELITMGLGLPEATGGVYSNTNYLLLGQLLQGEKSLVPDDLPHTGFPAGPEIRGPHPKMYERFFGTIDPPRDYSVYDMSWVGTGAALVSTVEDVNTFYRQLLTGRLVSPADLARMQQTGPVRSFLGETVDYGLGLHRFTVGGRTFWGHDGTVWGADTLTMSSPDGRRQMTVALNTSRWAPRPHPIDTALADFTEQAMTGGAG